MTTTVKNPNGLTTIAKVNDERVNAALAYVEDAISFLNYADLGTAQAECGMSNDDARKEATSFLAVAASILGQ